MHKKIAVIIPFFQKERGILRRAVLSVLRQEDIENVQIIIVDDESPVPASGELTDIPKYHFEKIRIIEQKNAGPGGARNKGLDSVDGNTEYVGFLDSDDEWEPMHLKNALFCLERGFDFYFSNFLQLGAKETLFERKQLDVSEHKRLQEDLHLYQYAGDMFNEMIISPPVGTSTVVYRYKKFPKMRFNIEYQFAGEDQIFWLELAQNTTEIAFSAVCEAKYGKGINVYASGDWGTDNSPIRIFNDMKYRKALVKMFYLNNDQIASIRRRIKGLRIEFAKDVLHRIHHRKKINGELLLKFIKMDPAAMFYIIREPMTATVKILMPRRTQI